MDTLPYRKSPSIKLSPTGRTNAPILYESFLPNARNALNIAVENIRKTTHRKIMGVNFEGRANLIGRKALRAIFSVSMARKIPNLLGTRNAGEGAKGGPNSAPTAKLDMKLT